MHMHVYVSIFYFSLVSRGGDVEHFHLFCWAYTIVCCKCFILMFAIATYVYSSFFYVLRVFQAYVASVLTVFGRMLQVFHLDVAKIDRVLHMLQCA